jgi:esterase/lipase
MYRTRFKKEIVTEFLPPVRGIKEGRVVIICDGMPSIPKKYSLADFLSRRGFWVFHPRWRGAWESDGEFLAKSPEEDIKDVIAGLEKKITESAYGQEFSVGAKEIYVLGSSFGGTAAILMSLDPRVKKTIAFCPVVDWKKASSEQSKETSNQDYPGYIKEAFGNGYRGIEKNWKKLYSGKFYNPMTRVSEFIPSKCLIVQTEDDPYVSLEDVKSFSKKTGIRTKLIKKGGHLSISYATEQYWSYVRKFINDK